MTGVSTRPGRAARAVAVLVLLTVALAGCSSGGHEGGATPRKVGATTALFDHPFTPDSPANRPLPSGTAFEAADGPLSSDLRSTGRSRVNSESWSFAFYTTTDKDPVVAVRSPDNWRTAVRVRLPRDATTTGGTDDHMGVVQPDGHTAYEFYKMHRRGDGSWTSPYVVKTDLRGTGLDGGVRASGTSIFWGVIRRGDLKAGRIDHTLALGVPNDVLRAGEVWPARLQDRDADTAYKGRVPMGSLFALPRSVDLGSLGLSKQGLMLGRALQRYGAYVMLRSSVVSLYAEKSADPSQVEALRAQWLVLRPLLRAVRDNKP